MKFRKLLTLVFIFSLTVLKSQEEPPEYIPNVFHQSPEVSSILKYSETPINYYTGLPSISIPLIDIPSKTLPISLNLNYHAGGIRVNEISNWVGLGWSITDLGQINRNVKQLPDDHQNGYYHENLYTPEYADSLCVSFGITQCVVLHEKYRNKEIDLEPDEFFLSLPNGKSSRFLINKSLQVVQFPETNLKIYPIFEGTRLKDFNVIDVDGTIYYFEHGNSISNTYSYSHSSDGNLSVESRDYVSFYTNWLLKKIQPTSGNAINFNYTEKSIEDCNFTNQTRRVRGSGSVNETLGEYVNIISTNYLKTIGKNFFLNEINGEFGRVIFISSDDREDYPNGKRLDKIKLINSNNEDVREIDFSYDYFISNNPSRTIYGCNAIVNENIITKRLKLKNINFINIHDEDEAYDYKFYYDPTNLPHRFSYAVDWWGYYNGFPNNYLATTAPWQNNVEKPNRHVNEDYTKASTLIGIRYPERGYTEFKYENNRGLYDDFFDEMIVPSIEKQSNFRNWQETPIEEYGTPATYVYNKDITLTNMSDIIKIADEYFIDLNFDSSSTSCNYNDEEYGDSLPLSGSCSIYFKLFSQGEEEPIMHKLINSNGVQRISLGENIPDELNLLLEVEIFTGSLNSPGNQVFDVENDVATINFSWNEFSDNVKRYGNQYEIPIGGLRIANINSYESEDRNQKLLSKSFSYLDEEGIESGNINFKLDFNQINIFAKNSPRLGVLIDLTQNYNSNSIYPLQTTKSNFLGYKNVTETIYKNDIEPYEIISDVDAFSIRRNYYNYAHSDCYLEDYPEGVINSTTSMPCFEDPLNGRLFLYELPDKLEKQSTYTRPIAASAFVKKSISGFDIDRIYSNYSHDVVSTCYYNFSNYQDKVLDSQRSIEKFNNLNFLEKTENFEYNEFSFPTKKITNNSLGENWEYRYYYPQGLLAQGVQLEEMQRLIDENRIGVPIRTETFKNEEKISTNFTKYSEFIDLEMDSNLLLPSNVFSKKGVGAIDEAEDLKITYDRYDAKGNILQYTLESGVPVSVIWGYNGQYPIAKVEGATYAQIENDEDNLHTLSDNDTDQTTEQNLYDALKEFRHQHSDFMITTYTYDPLIGVTRITPPNGQTAYYEYDGFGRLETVKDEAGNIIQDIEYHYKEEIE